MADDVIGTAAVELVAKTDKFKSDIQNAAKGASDSVSSAFKGIDTKGAETGMSSFGDSIKKIGIGLTAVITGPLAAFGAASLAASADIGKGYREIQKQTGDTGVELEKLKGSFKNVFANVPEDSTKVADALSILHQRTQLLGPQLEMLGTQFLDLSRIQGTDVVSSVDQATKVFTSWHIAAKNMADELDNLYTISLKFHVPLDTIYTSLTKNAGTWQGFNFTMDQAALITAKLTAAGIPLTSVISGLNKVVADAKKAHVDYNTELATLEKRISGAKTETQAMTIAQEYFSGKSLPTMVKAIRDGTFSFADLNKILTDSQGKIGDVADDTKTFTDRMTELKHRYEEALAPLGDQISTQMKAAIPWLDKGVGAVGTLTQELLKVPVAGTAFAVALGPGLLMMNTAMPAVSGLAQVMQALPISFTGLTKSIVGLIPGLGSLVGAEGFGGLATILPMLTNPVTLVIAGIAALGIAFGIAYLKIPAFKKAVDDTVTSLVNFAKVAVPESLTTLKTDAADITKSFSDLKPAVDAAGKSLSDFAKNVVVPAALSTTKTQVDNLKTSMDDEKTSADNLKTAFDNLKKSSDDLQVSLAPLTPIIGPMVTVFNDLKSIALPTIDSTSYSLLLTVLTALEAPLTLVAGLYEDIAIAQNTVATVINTAIGSWNLFVIAVNLAWGALTNWNTALSIAGIAFEIIKVDIMGVVDVITSGWNDALLNAMIVLNDMVQALRPLSPVLSLLGIDINKVADDMNTSTSAMILNASAASSSQGPLSALASNMATAGIAADIASGHIRTLQQAINELHDKNVTVTYTTLYQIQQALPQQNYPAGYGQWYNPATGQIEVIKKTQEGGIFTTPQTRVFAESGAEAVIPLTDPARAVELLSQISPMIGLPSMAMFGGQTGKKMSIAMNTFGTSGMVQWAATGGVATGPTIVGVGDKGAEALLPLSILATANDRVYTQLDNIYRGVCNLCTINYDTNQAIKKPVATVTKGPSPPVPPIPWWVVNPPAPYSPPSPNAPVSPISVGGGYTTANYQIPQPLMPTFSLSDMPPSVLDAMMKHLEASYGFQYANLTPEQQQTAWTTIQDQINRIIQSRMPALLMQFVPDFPAMVPYVQKAALDWVKGYIIAEIGKPGITIGTGAGQYKPFNPATVPVPPGVVAPPAPTPVTAAMMLASQMPGFADMPKYMQDAAIAWNQILITDEAAGVKADHIISWDKYVANLPLLQGQLSDADITKQQIIDAAKNDAVYQGLSNQWYKDQYIQWKLQHDLLLKQGWREDQIVSWDNTIKGKIPEGINAIKDNTSKSNSLLDYIKNNLPDSIAGPLTSILNLLPSNILGALGGIFSVITGAMSAFTNLSAGFKQFQTSIGTMLKAIPDTLTRIESYVTSVQKLSTDVSTFWSDLSKLETLQPTAVDYTALDEYQKLIDAMDKGVESNAQYLRVLAFGDPRSQHEATLLQDAQSRILNSMENELQKEAAAKEAENTAAYQTQMATLTQNVWNDLKTGFDDSNSLLNMIIEEIGGQGFMGILSSAFSGFTGMFGGISTIVIALIGFVALLGPLLNVLGITLPSLTTILTALGLTAPAAAILPASIVGNPLLLSTLLGTALPLVGGGALAPILPAITPLIAMLTLAPIGLQGGGIVKSPTLTMIAENRRPEAVIPLDEAFAPVNVIIQGDVYSMDMVNKIETVVNNAVQKRYRQMGVR